jgi:hypothetical protein
LSKSEKPFNPDTVIDQLLELSYKVTELLNSNDQYALHEIREINKEVTRLVKLKQAYNAEQMTISKNKQKNTK